MDSLQAIREHLDRIINGGGAMPALRKQWSDRYPSDSRPFRRQATKAWRTQAAHYREVRHWGKFRRAVMLGAVVLGRPFVIDFEQTGLLLLPGGVPGQEFSTCLMAWRSSLTPSTTRPSRSPSVAASVSKAGRSILAMSSPDRMLALHRWATDRANRLRIAEIASHRYGWSLHVIENCADDPPRDQPRAFLDALRVALGTERSSRVIANRRPL